MSLEEARNRALQFRDERDWKQFHNPKDLAISISLEAAELLETFQWSGSELELPEKIEDIKEELADVLIYCFYLADKLDLDVEEIIANKIERNIEHYPVSKAKGCSRKYTEL